MFTARLKHTCTSVHTHTYLHMGTYCVASACVCMLPEYVHGMNNVYMCCMCMHLQEYIHGTIYLYLRCTCKGRIDVQKMIVDCFDKATSEQSCSHWSSRLTSSALSCSHSCCTVVMCFHLCHKKPVCMAGSILVMSAVSSRACKHGFA